MTTTSTRPRAVSEEWAKLAHDYYHEAELATNETMNRILVNLGDEARDNAIAQLRHRR